MEPSCLRQGRNLGLNRGGLVAGGPLKPSFGLSGEWGCSDVTVAVGTTKLDYPHAMGTDAVPAQRSKSLRHLLLPPSPPFVTTDANRRIFESPWNACAHLQLQVYGYVVMPEHVHLLLSEPQRDTLANALKSLKQGVSRRLIANIGGHSSPVLA